jgi:NTP pyrophosphatase (non-canonical NTP hydrolase)
MSDSYESLTAKISEFSQLLDDNMEGEYNERLLARTLKVTEEAGELAAAVIRNLSRNVLKEDGEVTRHEVASHMLSLVVTAIALYDFYSAGGTPVRDLDIKMQQTLAWAKKQLGED